MRRIISLAPFIPQKAQPPSLESLQVARYARERATVVVADEIDIATAPQLIEALNEALLDEQDFTVDLFAVAFFGVSGLNAVVAAARTADRLGRRLQVVGARGTTRRLFEIAGFQSLLGVPESAARLDLAAGREEVTAERP